MGESRSLRNTDSQMSRAGRARSAEKTCVLESSRMVGLQVSICSNAEFTRPILGIEQGEPGRCRRVPSVLSHLSYDSSRRPSSVDSRRGPCVPSVAEEFERFRDSVAAAGWVLASTPALVCRGSTASFETNVRLTRANGDPNEDFYRWQLISALISTGRIPSDCIAAELQLPRGSRGSTDMFADVAIFRDASWIAVYNDLVAQSADDWSPLYDLLVGTVEVKDDPHDNMDRTVSRQVIPVLNSISHQYSLGGYFNSGHLVVFSRTVTSEATVIQRLDPGKQLTSGTPVIQLNLAVPDSWELFPTLEMILRRGVVGGHASRRARHIADLDVASSRTQLSVQSALNAIKRTLDETGTRAETGYRIVVEILAVKVFDELADRDSNRGLSFYLDPGEDALSGAAANTFRDRIKTLHGEAQLQYPGILQDSVIKWNNSAHRKLVTEVVRVFQDISFVRSAQSDLYQVVFYNFAGPLAKFEQSQFLTPLKLIEFLVEVTNPRPGEKVFDPTAGVADFLAVAYTRAREAGSPLDDSDLYGIDNDFNMVMLARLNMLLNGDGNARLRHIPDTGSLDYRLALDGRTSSVVDYRMTSPTNSSANWEPDDSNLSRLRFDMILTNPPFGDGRALKLNTPKNREIASFYAVSARQGGTQVDKGLIFLENAVRSLREGGRFAIVLSSAIAGVKEYGPAREWLLENVRLVAVFDMPINIFAETGVPTTLIVGYVPSPDRLSELQSANYEVFSRQITRVGFQKVTSQRSTLLVDRFLIDPDTGTAVHDPVTGRPLLDEEFTQTVDEFRMWARVQEPELQASFL